MESKKHPIIPNHYFAYPSSECQSLFENGFYYGFIALCQAVAEALARFMVKRGTAEQPSASIFKNLSLAEKGHVQPDVSGLLRDICGRDPKQRNDFHHLSKDVETSYEQLRAIATEKIDLLNKVESQVFEYHYDER